MELRVCVIVKIDGGDVENALQYADENDIDEAAVGLAARHASEKRCGKKEWQKNAGSYVECGYLRFHVIHLSLHLRFWNALYDKYPDVLSNFSHYTIFSNKSQYNFEDD